MLKISALKPSSCSFTKVIPSDNLFKELGKNTYNFKDMLSELIDNSIAARIDGKLLNVSIYIYYNNERKATKIIILDDAKGIEKIKLGKALSPAAIKTKNSLNEHGMGMKQAISGMGDLEYLATKVKDETTARVILELKFGDINTYESTEFPYDHGTEICIKNAKEIVTASASAITQHIVPYLGARYRNFLKPDNKLMNLEINLVNEETNFTTNHWDVVEVKPVYFHPSTRTNKPIILDFPVKGDGWQAKLTFGYAPSSKEELKELGLDKLEKYDPYYVSLSKQGIDILLHERVILFHQLSELGIVGSKHPSFNTIRGEIKLIKGFETAVTKNSIMEDTHYIELIKKITDILTGKEAGPGGDKKDYIEMKNYPEKLPEKLVRDRLKTWLKSNIVAPKENVETEYNVGAIEGFIDVIADGEAWEIKMEQASAYDVYQLFMYMDVGNIAKGYLLAKSFSTGANEAVKHIKTKHQKEIILDKLENFPIIHSATADERETYY